MERPNSYRTLRLISFVVLSSAVLILTFGPLAIRVLGGAIGEPRTVELARLSLKFDGASSCGQSKCHGEAKATEPPARLANQNPVWSDQDKHSTAFTTLTKADSDKIAKDMKLARKASEEQSCLQCHTLAVADNLHGDKYNVKEGVTCTACHGPSEKWVKPHADAGWTEKMRGSMKGDELLKTWGLYNTKPPVMRAEMCTSCHLAIDAKMVAAGHPQPRFELATFCTNQPKHWRDPGGYFDVKLWAVGQAVCARDAMKQLADRAKGGVGAELVKQAYDQGMAHLSMLRELMRVVRIQGLDAHVEAVKKAMAANNNNALAAAATAAAGAATAVIPAADGYQPGKTSVVALLQALASDPSISKDFGDNGMDQQAMSLIALYGSYAAAEKAPDAEAVTKLMTDKLFPAEGKTLDAAGFAAALNEVKAKLPAQ